MSYVLGSLEFEDQERDRQTMESLLKKKEYDTQRKSFLSLWIGPEEDDMLKTV